MLSPNENWQPTSVWLNSCHNTETVVRFHIGFISRLLHFTCVRSQEALALCRLSSKISWAQDHFFIGEQINNVIELNGR